ncbi:MAG: dockerin type I domain-containing protein [Planctomycetota bacterium]
MNREGFRDDAALARLGAIAVCRTPGVPGLRRARAAAAFLLAIAAANLVGNVRFAASATGAGCSLPEQAGIVPPAGDLPMKEFDVRRWTMTAAAAATVSLASASHATDRLVPQQYPTIQAAVNASVNGDTITLAPGLYREAVELRKSVVLRGSPTAQASQVILTAVGVPGQALLLGFTGSSYDGPVTIRNLTIDGESTVESGQRAGMHVYPLGPTNALIVEDCIFRDLRSANADGGAIWTAHSPMLVRRCLFAGNRSTVHGAAVYAADNVQPLVERCVFVDHSIGTGTFYAGIGSNMTVRDCIIRNSNALTAHFEDGIVTMSNNTGCQIGALSNGGYVDGGGNDWDGPCPDCDANGVIDLEEILFGAADCNGNGVVDACDLAANPKLDRNDDGVIDACQCIPDITGNGLVDGVDLAAVLSAWGTAGNGEFNCDVSGDGVVSGPDLSIVLGGWGPCP